MMPFFKGASFTPSCSPLDRGTQQHHFLSKLALVMAQYLCPVFSDCSWQVSSNRVTSRNNSASFLSFSASLGSFPSPQFICPLLFGIALLSPQTLPLVCKSTGFLSIVFASVFFFHAQALSLLQGRLFCGRKEGYIPVQLFFPLDGVRKIAHTLECQLCTQPHTKDLLCMTSFNPQNSPVRRVLALSLHAGQRGRLARVTRLGCSSVPRTVALRIAE